MPTFADFLKDMLEEAAQGLPGVVTRPYFGGTGIYKGGAIFALVSREPRLYLRLRIHSAEQSSGAAPM